MDELILAFSPAQHQKYCEIKERAEREEISLDFDISLLPNISEDSLKDIKPILQEISACVQELLSLCKISAVWFCQRYTAEELDSIRNAFLNVLRNLSTTKAELCTVQLNAAAEAERLDLSHLKLMQAYAEFLPYKAALAPYSQYSKRISDIESAYKAAISRYDINISVRKNLIARIDNIYNNIIDEYVNNSTKAADFPNMENMNAELLFKHTRDLSEQLKHV